MRATSLEWIVRECRFKPRTVEVLTLLWVQGLTRPAAARVLAVSTPTVQKLEARAKVRMQRLYDAAGPGERALWETMFGEDDESQPLDLTAHARALLRAMRGPRPHCPTSPEYDELGREIGRRPPLVSVDEAIAAILSAEQERGRKRGVQNVFG